MYTNALFLYVDGHRYRFYSNNRCMCCKQSRSALGVYTVCVSLTGTVFRVNKMHMLDWFIRYFSLYTKTTTTRTQVIQSTRTLTDELLEH